MELSYMTIWRNDNPPTPGGSDLVTCEAILKRRLPPCGLVAVASVAACQHLFLGAGWRLHAAIDPRDRLQQRGQVNLPLGQRADVIGADYFRNLQPLILGVRIAGSGPPVVIDHIEEDLVQQEFANQVEVIANQRSQEGKVIDI